MKIGVVEEERKERRKDKGKSGRETIKTIKKRKPTREVFICIESPLRRRKYL